MLADALRPGAPALIARLRACGIVPVLLSGDRAATVAASAAALGIADARGDALPEDKRDAIAALQAGGAVVAMVGDGVNDAPSLAQAQVSISLGSATPLAQWTADVVVLGDELLPIADAIAHARRTLTIVRENLGWAFAYNIDRDSGGGVRLRHAARWRRSECRCRRWSSSATRCVSRGSGRSRCARRTEGGPPRDDAARHRMTPAPMDILILLIPLSVVLVLLIGAGFWWSVRSGQFDDLEGPAHRILDDDDTSVAPRRRRPAARSGAPLDLRQTCRQSAISIARW